MNSFTRFIQRTVARSSLEEFFVSLRKRVNVVRKFIPRGIRHRFVSVGRFIPQAEVYPADDSYLLTRDDTRFRINRSDYVQWRIFYGVRDNSLLQAKKYLTDHSIVLDIGSNFGAFSLRLASHALQENLDGFQLHAFEPNPVVLKNLNENLELNPQLKHLVYIHHYGLGNESGQRSFDYSTQNSGAGRIIREGKISIDIQRLDDFIEQLNPPKIGFIKLIVEGFEPEVFKGGMKTIEKYRPPIFFEVTPEWYAEHGATLSDILDKLTPLGYKFYGELHNELVPYETAKFEKSIQFNLFARI